MKKANNIIVEDYEVVCYCYDENENAVSAGVETKRPNDNKALG